MESTKKDKPNLFQYATSELSHDAFIAWLLAWAHPSFEEQRLNKISTAILEKMFELADKKLPDIKKVEVNKQYRNIDVLLKITTNTDNTWAVIIEDKIYSKQHSNQLMKYRENILKEDNDITEDQHIIGIYYKMWEQSNLDQIISSKYQHFERGMMLNILNSYQAEYKNNILKDYYLYLRKMEEGLNIYKKKPIGKWIDDKKREQWIGFYSQLKKDLGDGNFGYVSNSRGGFYAYWFGGQAIGKNDQTDKRDELYIQVEEEKLCFKVHTHKNSEREDAKWFWNNKIIESAKHKNLNVIKPPVMRMGEYCTVGILNTEETDYWMPINQDGIIDYKKSLNLLKKAQELVTIASNYEPNYKN